MYKTERKKYLIFLLITLVFIRFYSYQPFISGWYAYLVEFPFLLFAIYKFFSIKINYGQLNFTKDVSVLMLLPLLSSIPCYILHGQSFIDSLNASHYLFVLLFYFYFRQINISSSSIEKGIIVISFIFTSLYLIQQFTYPNYWFYTRSDTIDEAGYFHQIEIRNGFYRFFMVGDQILIIGIFLITQRIANCRKRKDIFLFLFFFLGLIMTGSRQYISLVSLLVMYSMFRYSGHGKSLFLKLVIVLSVLFIVSFVYKENIESTSDQIENRSDDTRTASVLYFMGEMNNPLALGLGHGIPFKSSSYGIKMVNLSEMGIINTDVGIIGFFYERGIIYILFILFFYISFYRKYFKKIPLYLKSFFLYLVLNVFVFPIARFDNCIVMVVFFTLSDLYLNYDSNIREVRTIV